MINIGPGYFMYSEDGCGHSRSYMTKRSYNVYHFWVPCPMDREYPFARLQGRKKCILDPSFLLISFSSWISGERLPVRHLSLGCLFCGCLTNDCSFVTYP